MPRSGPLGTYTLPGAQKTQQPNTVIQSAVNNQGYADIEQTFNTPTPLSYGGTGASTAGGAADALSPAYVNVASGATTNIGAATSPNVIITGTNGITAFDDAVAGITRYVRASGIFTLTHSAALLLPANGANITTAANDTFTAKSLGSGDWIVTDYQRASGQALIAPANLATKVDVRRNRIVNGDKLLSSVSGQTAGTTNGRQISDANFMYFVTSAGTFTGVNVNSTLSPAGGFRDRITITTPDAALAAGEFLTYTQNIDGGSVRDLKWGTAGARPIMLRRGFKFPAGTWTVAFHNGAANRSYITTFTVSAPEANTDIVREFAIPGDTTGTWLNTDGSIGLTMDVVIGAGSTFQGVSGWQAGNLLTVVGATNGMASSGAVFEFFDEGLRMDPDATGAYGQYEVTPALPFTKEYVSTQQTITSAGALTLMHGLGAVPKSVDLELVCTTADSGFSVGERISVSPGISTANNLRRGILIKRTTTSIVVRYGENTQVFEVIGPTDGVPVALTNARWQLIVRAWA